MAAHHGNGVVDSYLETIIVRGKGFGQPVELLRPPGGETGSRGWLGRRDDIGKKPSCARATASCKVFAASSLLTATKTSGEALTQGWRL